MTGSLLTFTSLILRNLPSESVVIYVLRSLKFTLVLLRIFMTSFLSISSCFFSILCSAILFSSKTFLILSSSMMSLTWKYFYSPSFSLIEFSSLILWLDYDSSSSRGSVLINFGWGILCFPVGLLIYWAKLLMGETLEVDSDGEVSNFRDF